MHDLAQIRLRGLHEEVVVVRHENITVQDNTVFLLGLFQIGEKLLVVCPSEEYLVDAGVSPVT